MLLPDFYWKLNDEFSQIHGQKLNAVSSGGIKEEKIMWGDFIIDFYIFVVFYGFCGMLLHPEFH